MIVRNVTVDQIDRAIHRINEDEYDGKITTQNGINVIRTRKNGNVDVRVALRTVHSKVHGSRESASGRNIPAACWHSFRDMFRELFKINPDAVVVSAFAKFTADNFEDSYLSTYWNNAGSMMYPVSFGDLCYDCSEGCR